MSFKFVRRGVLFSVSLSQELGRSVFPPPPAGYAYLTDDGGTFLVDDNGFYLLGELNV